MCAVMKKYRILFFIELVCIMLALPLCFVKEETVYCETGDDVGAGERLILGPGVYQLRVSATMPEGTSAYFTVRCEESTFQALRCNGAVMYGGQETLDFEVYVLDTVDSAYIENTFQGTDIPSDFSISLTKTHRGGRILCFCILIVSLCINFLVLFRDEILAGKVSRQQQAAFWMLLLSVALAYFPYATDYFDLGGNTAFHLLRIEGLKETLLQGGQFPVRVQNCWLYDHGYAVSTFCSDLFLMIPVLFRIIGFSLMTSYKLFVLVVMAVTAWLAYYSFKRCTQSIYSALFGSIIYVLAPFRLYLFYNRGAMDEYLGMAFLPLVFYGMYRLYTEKTDSPAYSGAKIPLIIGLSCILQSHLPTCGVIVLFVLAVCLIFWKKTFHKRLLLQLAETAGISLLLNCWFWLPMCIMLGKDKYSLTAGKGMSAPVTSLGIPDAILMIVSALCAMLAAFFVVWLRVKCRLLLSGDRRAALLQKGLLIFIGIMVVGSAVYQVNNIVYKMDVVRLYTAENIGTISVAGGEFLPDGANVEEYSYHYPVAEDGLEWSSYRRNGVNMEIFLENTTLAERYLELPLTGYKGYQLDSTDTEDEVPYITEERGKHGDLRIAVPAGYQGNITVEYKGFGIYRTAEAISMVTLFCMVVYMINRRRGKWLLKRKQ